MNVKKILVPTDFSEHSQAAIRQGAALARESGAQLLMIHVMEPIYADTGYSGFVAQEDEEDARRLLEEEAAKYPGTETKLLRGHPAHEIVEVAEKENVDMIVIATHGRTGLVRLLMGSVAEEVVRRAKCSVLTVKQAQLVKDEGQ